MKSRKLLRRGLLRLNLARKIHRDILHHTEKTGKPPGYLVYTGKKGTDRFRIEVIDYDEDELTETEIVESAQITGHQKNRKKTWFNAFGLNHVQKIKEIGELFEMDELLVEDLLNVHNRSKIDFFDDYLYLNIKMMSIEGPEDDRFIDLEQVSFILGKDWILSFQEEEGDVFDQLRKRIKDQHTVLRKKEIDYLFYRLVDTVVDHYFLIVEHISDRIEYLEDEIVINPKDDIRIQMQLLRKDIILLRKAVVPLREAVGSLARDENKFVSRDTRRYFRDVYEHIIQLHEYIDTQRDMLASLGDLYLSGVSHKMNQIMKVLTIISTIFIPLTFIAGIYGMNFINMPELEWEHGYLGTLGIMALIVIGMIFYFKRKGWI